MGKNYYQILEVDKNASNEIIKKIFKIHIKNNHPDLFKGKEKLEAEEKIKVINEAYEIISDDTKRKKYDLEIAETESLKNNVFEKEITFLKNQINKKDEIIEILSGKPRRENRLFQEEYNEINSQEHSIDDLEDEYEDDDSFQDDVVYMSKWEQLIRKTKYILKVIAYILMFSIIFTSFIFQMTGFNLYSIFIR